ncbi:MAG: DUF4252 domain-containing protein [Chloroflexota bacterium]
MLVAAALAGALAAQQPGRIQLTFNGLAQRAAEVSNVTLDGPMLQVGIRMLSAKESDAQARQVLSRLKGVYVKSFRFDRRDAYSGHDLEPIHRQLHEPGWHHIMSVHSHRDGRSVNIYLMAGAQGVEGMVIIAAYPRALRVVNLVGPIDPAALSQLGGHFGIPRMKPRHSLSLTGAGPRAAAPRDPLTPGRAGGPEPQPGRVWQRRHP